MNSLEPYGFRACCRDRGFIFKLPSSPAKLGFYGKQVCALPETVPLFSSPQQEQHIEAYPQHAWDEGLTALLDASCLTPAQGTAPRVQQQGRGTFTDNCTHTGSAAPPAWLTRQEVKTRSAFIYLKAQNRDSKFNQEFEPRIQI